MESKRIAKKKTYETVKKESRNSLNEDDDVEELVLSEIANQTNDPRKAMLTIRRCKDIIKTQNK